MILCMCSVCAKWMWWYMCFYSILSVWFSTTRLNVIYFTDLMQFIYRLLYTCTMDFLYKVVSDISQLKGCIQTKMYRLYRKTTILRSVFYIICTFLAKQKCIDNIEK